MSGSTGSFRDRAARFWAWFEAEAGRFRAAFDAGTFEEVFDEVTAGVHRLGDDLVWQLCPTEHPEQLGFALSPDGDPDLRLLTGYVVEQAPELEGWEWFAAKPADVDPAGSTIGIAGREFHIEEFAVQAQIDSAHGRVDVRLFHPAFGDLDERARSLLAKVFLDTVLGEDGITNWLGEIELVTDAAPDGALDLLGLRSRVRLMLSEAGLDPDRGPEEAWTVYELTPEAAAQGGDRGDIIAGSTCTPWLLDGWFDAEAVDPLAGTGAGYASLAFSMMTSMDGDEIERRGEVEDRLDEALRAAGDGRVVGGAFAQQQFYIDLLLFDEERGIVAVQRALLDCPEVSGARLRSFASRAAGGLEIK